VLASASPRRAVLVEALGLVAESRPAAVDEMPEDGESARSLTRRLAHAKADAVVVPGRVVLAADTVVTATGRVLGQPRDRADARRVLHALAGRGADVVTHVAVVAADGRRRGRSVRSRLVLREASSDAIDDYLATGEADDKAGALAVQGAGASLVDHVEGCWSNVVGLPVCATTGLLRWAGIRPAARAECAGMRCLPPGAPASLLPDGRFVGG
jgi:septum formation protein